MGVVNSEGETPLDIAEEEAMEELLKNEVNRQGGAQQTRSALKHPLNICSREAPISFFWDTLIFVLVKWLRQKHSL